MATKSRNATTSKSKSAAAPAAKAKARAAPAARKRAAKKAAKGPAHSAAPKAGMANPFAGFAAGALPGAADMAKLAKILTPAQAIELYKVNSKLALDVISAALDNTAKLRRHQFEGEEQARAEGGLSTAVLELGPRCLGGGGPAQITEM